MQRHHGTKHRVLFPFAGVDGERILDAGSPLVKMNIMWTAPGFLALNILHLV